MRMAMPVVWTAMWKRVRPGLLACWLVCSPLVMAGCASERDTGTRADLAGYRRVVVLPIADPALADAVQRTLADAGFERIAASADELHRDPAYAAAALVCGARVEGASSLRVRLRLSDYATGTTRYTRILLAHGPSAYPDALHTLAGDLAR